jgi:amino acid adenylation domain-containing protein
MIETLVDSLSRLALQESSSPVVTFVEHDDPEPQILTALGLDEKARSVAVALASLGTRGDRALIVCPPSPDFVGAFYGCLYGGFVAVPCPAPASPSKAERLRGILLDTTPTAILTVHALEPTLNRVLTGYLDHMPATTVCVDLLPRSLADHHRGVPVDQNDIAFLQFTSGSTRTPRGVMVSHGNLMANIAMIEKAFGIHNGQCGISWLPIYHDMGLVSLLLSQHIGSHTTILAPESFVADPLKWLRLVSASDRPVVNAAPAFALDFCVERLHREDLVGLDLARWDALICGAEPIRQHAIESFARLLQPTGFRRSAMHTAFGLAEATMFVCAQPCSDVTLEVDPDELEHGALVPSDLARRARESPRPAALLTGCGSVHGDSEIVVVDPKSARLLPEGAVGEVWVSGPQVARGYWGDPSHSDGVFDARIGDAQPGDGKAYLRTGDLGAVHDGQLYVTGRLKDMILIRGRNIYPSDVEYVAGCAHEACVKGMSAAFSLLGEDKEGLIVLQGVSSNWRGDFALVTGAVRRAVIESCEVEPQAVVLVSPLRIPRTTSGKVRRGRCRELWSGGQLDVIYEEKSVAEGALAGSGTDGPPTAADIRAIPPAARASAITRWLVSRVAHVAGLPPWRVGVDDVLQGLGLDSVKIIRLFSEITSALDVSLSGEALTISGLTVEITCAMAACEPAPSLHVHVSKTQSPDRGQAPNGTPSGHEDRHVLFPLTDLQHAYMVGRSQAFELGGISASVYFEFDGELEPDLLGASLRQMIERHEMLRAVVDPGGSQRILQLEEIDWGRFGLVVTDMRSRTDAEARTEILALRESMIGERLDLHAGPLFHVHAVLRPGDRTSLHIGFDLLIADMASIRIFFSEWRTLYDGGVPAPQPLEFSFRDWVIARQASLAADGAEFRQAREYWHERAPHLPGAPELPTIASPPGPPRFTRRERRFGEGVTVKIHDLAGTHGVSLTIALLSAYAATLARWSRSQRFTLGLTLYDRPADAPLADSVIGDFTSLDLLEIDSVSPRSFADLAAATQRRLWQDLAHRAYPGTRVLRDLGAARKTSATRAAMPVVFTSGIGLSGRDRPTEWMGKLVLNISRTPQVMLDCQLIEDGEDLLLIWDSVDSLFPGDVLDDMFAGYVELVEALTHERRWLGSPTVDPAAEPMRIHSEVNKTAGPLTSELLHERVLSTARCNPTAPAVITDDGMVTFGELVNHALSTAGALSRAGVAGGSLVGIAMSRGWRCVSAMLAALLTGAAYCPIDLEQPEQRRRAIVENAKLDCLMIEGEQASAIAWLPQDVPVLSMPVASGSVEWRACDRFAASAPDDVAYVIYTSGSTGRPKGVAVSHRAARNTCDDICERYRFTVADRVLALSSTAFDLSVFDIFGVLGAGGAIVIPRPASRPDPAHWCQLIGEHNVTVWNSVPALAEMLVEQMTPGRVDAGRVLPLRLVLLSGDWIALSLPGRIRRLAPNAEVVSLGGATEAAIWSLHHPIETVDRSMSSIPYGTPLRNQTAHVLNERLEPCPDLVAGALYIGGSGLALGYWRDQDFTRERFITHPASGERLYRTGDLARWRPEGVIELLGREDFQVKIAGQRVELGEIEQILLEHPRVERAAVVASGERRRQQLVAFVTAGGNGSQAHRDETAHDGFIEDPLKRLEFKLRRLGRRDLRDYRLVVLHGSQWWSEDGARRVSCRSFAAAPLQSGLLGQLLSIMRAHEDGAFARHAYASADGLYPVQVYLQIMRGRVNEIDAGVYCYEPSGHRLALLAQDDRLAVDPAALLSLADEPAFLIYLVASSAAIEPLYGSLWRDFALIEVGLICQLLEDGAARYGLGLCQLGGAAPASRFAEHLDLGAGHELLHALAGGVPRTNTNGLDPPSNGSVAKAASLRSYLNTRLPAHMVPHTVVELDAMPLTDTGKLDRAALQAIAADAALPARGHVDPVGDIERLVVSQIEAVLGVERVGATDNLFDLGANSVALVQIHCRLREQLEQDLSLLTIFECPNARALAAQLAGLSAEAGVTERGSGRSGPMEQTRRSSRMRDRTRR